MSWRRAFYKTGPHFGSLQAWYPPLHVPLTKYFFKSRRLPCNLQNTSILGRCKLSSIASSTVPQLPHHDSQDTPSTTNMETIFQQIHDAASSSNLSEMHAAYQSLLEDASVNTVRGEFQDIIISSLHALALSNRPCDLALIDRILEKMQHRWGIPVTSHIHTTILEALLRHGEDGTITRWLLNMPSKPGGCKPTPEQWNSFLLRCQKEKKPDLLKSTIGVMRFSGCTPTEATYMILIHALFRSQLPLPRLAVVRGIMTDMQNDKVAIPNAMRDIMSESYVDTNSRKLACKVEELHEKFSQSGSEDKLNALRAKQLAVVSNETGGRAGARKMLARFRKEGFIPSTRTLATVVENSQSTKDLVFWETLLEVKANCHVFSIVIRNAAQSGNRYAAVELLRTARSARQLPMTAAMVHPVLRVLCMSKFGPAPDIGIDNALELLGEYVHQYDDEQVFKEVVSNPPSQDVPLYNTVLRALTSSTNKKYFPIAVSLVEEMRKRGVRLDPMSATSVIILLLKISPTAVEAFEMYKLVCKDAKGRCVLDSTGYVAVLDTFCKLRVSADQMETITRLYFEIVKDMRMGGHPIPIEVYTILLRQLGDRIIRSPRDDTRTRDQLTSVVRRAHDMISVDGSLVPDVVLWNELMNTYQKAGSFQDAFRLWESMQISHQYDHASVSIILDACAFAGAHEMAVKVYDRIHEDGFEFNQKNWNNWLECLCRLGRLDEAVKVFCLEIGQLKQEGVGPSVQGLRLLLRFSIRTNEESLVRSRVKRYLPEFWAKVPESLRGIS